MPFILGSTITNDKIAQLKELVNDETVDVNAIAITKDKEGMSPLLLVLLYYREENFFELVQDLLLNGADVNSTVKTNGDGDFFIKGMTPLHLLFCRKNIFMMRNFITIVQLLLSKNADVNVKDGHGMTPLHYLLKNYANENVMKDVIPHLLEKDADVNAKDDNGRTSLHYLFHYYNSDNMKDIVQLLLTETGADVNARDKYGWTPLHHLCRYYRNDNLKDVAQLLVDRGADLTAKNEDGNTPLHYFCENCKMFDTMNEETKNKLNGLFLFFQENGAKIYAKNKDGTMPADLLRERGFNLHSEFY